MEELFFSKISFFNVSFFQTHFGDVYFFLFHHVAHEKVHSDMTFK